MAMTAGSATITTDSTGGASFSGSGMAYALAVQRFARYVTQYQGIATAAGGTLPSAVAAAYQAIANDVADDCGAMATAIVEYIQANATAHVTTQALGWTPEPNNAGTLILPPVNNTIPAIAPVDIPIT